MESFWDHFGIISGSGDLFLKLCVNCACPGLACVAVVAVDGSDELQGGAPSLEAIVASTRPDRQLLVFAAAWPDEVRRPHSDVTVQSSARKTSLRRSRRLRPLPPPPSGELARAQARTAGSGTTGCARFAAVTCSRGAPLTQRANRPKLLSTQAAARPAFFGFGRVALPWEASFLCVLPVLFDPGFPKYPEKIPIGYSREVTCGHQRSRRHCRQGKSTALFIRNALGEVRL